MIIFLITLPFLADITASLVEKSAPIILMVPLQSSLILRLTSGWIGQIVENSAKFLLQSSFTSSRPTTCQALLLMGFARSVLVLWHSHGPSSAWPSAGHWVLEINPSHFTCAVKAFLRHPQHRRVAQVEVLAPARRPNQFIAYPFQILQPQWILILHPGTLNTLTPIDHHVQMENIGLSIELTKLPMYVLSWFFPNEAWIDLWSRRTGHQRVQRGKLRCNIRTLCPLRPSFFLLVWQFSFRYLCTWKATYSRQHAIKIEPCAIWKLQTHYTPSNNTELVPS